MKKGKNKKDLADQLIADIRNFKQTQNCSRLVMVWCGSTEVYMKETAAHASVASFEKALEESDDAIPSSMVYAYAAIREGLPFASSYSVTFPNTGTYHYHCAIHPGRRPSAKMAVNMLSGVPIAV